MCSVIPCVAVWPPISFDRISKLRRRISSQNMKLMVTHFQILIYPSQSRSIRTDVSLVPNFHNQLCFNHISNLRFVFWTQKVCWCENSIVWNYTTWTIKVKQEHCGVMIRLIVGREKGKDRETARQRERVIKRGRQGESIIKNMMKIKEWGCWFQVEQFWLMLFFRNSLVAYLEALCAWMKQDRGGWTTNEFWKHFVSAKICANLVQAYSIIDGAYGTEKWVVANTWLQEPGRCHASAETILLGLFAGMSLRRFCQVKQEWNRFEESSHKHK